MHSIWDWISDQVLHRELFANLGQGVSAMLNEDTGVRSITEHVHWSLTFSRPTFFFYLLLVLIIFKTIFKVFCGTRTMWNMFPQEKENWFPISSQYMVVLHFTATQHDSTEMAAGRITALCQKREHINLVTSLLVSQHSAKVFYELKLCCNSSPVRLHSWVQVRFIVL